MIIVRSVAFTPQETEVFATARSFATVAFPGGPAPSQTRAADRTDDETRLRALNRLANNSWDPVDRDGLMLAVDALTVLRDQTGRETDPAYWRAQVPAGRAASPTETGMTRVLIEARAIQIVQAQEALDLAREALDRLDPVDVPRYWRELQKNA